MSWARSSVFRAGACTTGLTAKNFRRETREGSTRPWPLSLTLMTGVGLEHVRGCWMSMPRANLCSVAWPAVGSNKSSPRFWKRRGRYAITPLLPPRHWRRNDHRHRFLSYLPTRNVSDLQHPRHASSDRTSRLKRRINAGATGGRHGCTENQ